MENFNRDNQSNNNEPASNRTPEKQQSKFGIGLAVGILVTVAVVLAVAVALLFFLFRGGLTRSSKPLTGQEKMDTIRQYLDKFYLGETDEEALTDSLADGLLSGIGDDYAKYYNKEEFSMLMDETAGEYSGIGVSVIMNADGQVEVTQVFKGSPAEKAGVKPNDLIVEAAGERSFEDLDALIKLVRGEEGSQVDLVFLREGKEIPVSMERKNIKMETVEYEMLDGKIGYIRLLEFDTISIEQFNQALDDLEKQGARSLILDLRNNPGGDYDTVMTMADRVLPKGNIAQIINNAGEVKYEQSDDEHKITLPMAVLINENSASAAELFSGAIKDYGIATMIGKTTYGKGVIQSIFRLSDGSGMKFTTEEYLTPKGNKIDGVGVIPDIEVDIPEKAYEDGIITKEEDTQLKKAIEELQKETPSSLRN